MNNKLIRLDEATQLQVFSRDLREYVVPVRELNRLHTVDDAEQTEAENRRCWAVRRVFSAGCRMLAASIEV